MPLFSGKARKECFSFHEKHIRDGFYVTFSLVRKSNQKVPQRSADLWTPGERFKTRAVRFQVKVERFCALRFFGKFYKCHNTHGHVLNRRKRAVAVLTQNRILQKIEVAVQA